MPLSSIEQTAFDQAVNNQRILRTKASTSAVVGCGQADLISSLLFLAAVGDFRRSPTKKKAILIYEVWLNGNHGCTESHELCPEFPHLIAKTVVFLGKNLEAGGGVPRDAFTTIDQKFRLVLQAYRDSRGYRRQGFWKHRWHVKSKKLGNLGGGVDSHMFLPAVKKMASDVSKLIDSPANSSKAESTETVLNGLRSLAFRRMFKSAGFSLPRLGLIDIPFWE